MSSPKPRPKCEDCNFASLAFAGNSSTVLECHRYPPVHVDRKFKGSGPDVAFFPFVNTDDWCGEWKSPA